VDSLTGAKSKLAYGAVREQLDDQINGSRFVEFAMAVFVLKNLPESDKPTGPDAEIQWLKEASNCICDLFKRSPVFRVDRDEFVVISQGKDYEHFDSLIERFEKINKKNMAEGGIVIPFGTAKYDKDLDTESVYQRAVENLKAKNNLEN
jgi:GGDEF domain-containing protein